MKRLPDGATVFISHKTVVGFSLNDMFIEEADRSSGIRVDLYPAYPASPLRIGNTVSFIGAMGTAYGERIVRPRSVIEHDFTASVPISSLAMASPAIMGWPINFKQPRGPRATGLVPIGLLVKVWGRVHAVNSVDPMLSLNYVYLDDGWGMLDGISESNSGVRVYSDRIPSPDQDFLTAVGVCSTITYDPGPVANPDNEFVVPVIRTTNVNDLDTVGGDPVASKALPVTGRVRLIGRSAPGTAVRVYTEKGDTVLENVTDQWTPFTLPAVSVSGAKITASATGYVSSTVEASGGRDSVDIELAGAQLYTEISTDIDTVHICSDESAAVTCMLRDSEGKGLPHRQIKLSTTLGTFADSRTRETVLSTDYDGFAQIRLTAWPDAKGIASVRVDSYPAGAVSSQVGIKLDGPSIGVSADRVLLSQPGSSAITAHVVDRGLPVANAPVAFTTDLGTFRETGGSSCSTLTNGSGDAHATLVMNSPGTAKVLAVSTNSCGHETVGWVVVSYGTQPWFSQGVQASNPLVADLTGNGKKNVVVVTSIGDLVALASDGAVLWSVPMHPTGSNSPACAALDIERSGLPCIFLPSESQQKLYGFGHDGTQLAGWPVGSDYRFAKCSAAIADANLDGSPEIVAGDECCYVFSWNPTGDWRGTGTADSSYLWRNLTGSASTAIYGSSCAVGDIGGDPSGMPGVVVGTNRAPEVYAFPGDAWGDQITNPLYTSGWPKSSNGRAESSPAIGDLDGDGHNDVAIGSDDGNVYVWLSGSASWAQFPVGEVVRSSPALCDLDGDGKLDVIVGADSGRVFAFNWLGQAIAGWAGGVLLNSTGAYGVKSSPVVGDVTGDGQVDVVIGCNDGSVYALYKDAMNHSANGKKTGPIAWVRSCVPPGQSSAQVTSTPVIDDLDNDGKVEVVAAGDKGIYVFHFDAPYVKDPALYPWPTFHHDNQRTGCAAPAHAPVSASIQGIVTMNRQPVARASVEIYYEDGSPVLQPYSDPPVPRVPVLSVGGATSSQLCKGAYSINQLESHRTYKLKVSVTGQPQKWVPDVTVTTGLLRVDIAL